MTASAEGVRLFTPGDVGTWYKAKGGEIFLGDVVDESNSETMSVGFARYGPGESNDWVVAYDEVLVVTSGSYSVTPANGSPKTARVGEFIFLTKGTALVYSAGDEGAEVVYVTYPDWTTAQRASENAHLLETFGPVERVPRRSADGAVPDNIELLRGIWGPIERGESDDLGPFFDALAEDVVFSLPVGAVQGKQSVIDYFARDAELMEFNPYERPLEYFGHGDRVVLTSEETIKIKKTGLTHRAWWAWVFDVRDGLITRIECIQDLSPIADVVREALGLASSARSSA